MEKLIRELSTSATDTLAMIDAIGDSLLSGIKCRIATLKKQLQSEHCSKLEKLQLVARELEAPRELYQQMKMLLQHHNSFLLKGFHSTIYRSSLPFRIHCPF